LKFILTMDMLYHLTTGAISLFIEVFSTINHFFKVLP
jgi:hypothetical protein